MNKLKAPSTDTENFYAEEIVIDEGGVELFVGGELELGASFESLDNFELAYRVLPEDFELEQTSRYDPSFEQEVASRLLEAELEMTIWINSQELAKRRGYAK